jgi:hypothetical protein
MKFPKLHSGDIHRMIDDVGYAQVACFMDDEEYRTCPGLSSTALRQFIKSPAHYKSWRDMPSEDSPALRFGRLVDAVILDPPYYERMFRVVERVVPPKAPERPAALKGIRRKKDPKDCPIAAWEESWKPDFDAEMAKFEKLMEEMKDDEEKEFITAEEERKAFAMRSRVMDHKKARMLLTGGFPKLTLFWLGSHAVQCKAQLDYLNPILGLVDYKTAITTEPYAFQKHSLKYGYNLQQAFYLTGLRTVIPDIPAQAWLVVQEKSGPLGVRVFSLSEKLIQWSTAKCNKAVGEFYHLKNDEKPEWQCYPEKIHTLDLPEYLEEEMQ